jgi:ribosomal-protein-alanine acetyltransferase
MNIRDGRAEDLGAMVALERQSPTAAHWAESFYIGLFEDGAQDRVLLVAEEEGAPRGFLLARIIGDECELENIVVAESNRRHGLGSKLIRALINAARGRDATCIFLEVRESNVTARSFYETCGFSSDGCRKSYYGDPAEDAVLYTLAM